MDVALRVARQVKAALAPDNVPVSAAGIAFYLFLAIPAALTAVLSISGLILDESTVRQQVEDNLDALPESARDIIGEQLESISSTAAGGLVLGLVLSIALALWSVSSALLKLIATLNVIYDEEETRNMLRLRGLVLALTLGALVFIAASGFVLAVLPPLLAEAGLGDAARWLINTLRFPALGLAMTVGLSILYQVGPAGSRGPFRPISWGSAIAAVVWLAMSGLFSVYTANFGSYNETYGSLAAVVVLLLWLLITAYAVLLGAEIDVALANDRATRDRPQDDDAATTQPA